MSAPGATPAWIPRKRRTAELGLLLLAIAIGIGSYAAVGLGIDGTVPAGIYTVGAVYAVVALGAHLAVRRFAGYADPVLLPLVVALNGIGLTMIYRIDLGLEANGSGFGPFAQGQLRWIVLDEAHGYVGAQAAEMALLLRRVQSAFGVDPAKVRLMATSATISEGRNTREKLTRFVADLAGVDEWGAAALFGVLATILIVALSIYGRSVDVKPSDQMRESAEEKAA